MQVTIAERFNGPPGVGNGGYVCGLIAAGLQPAGAAAQVSLFLPAPLGIPLTLQRTLPGPVRLLHHEAVVAEGHAFTGQLEAPPPPSPAEAAEALRALRRRPPVPDLFRLRPATRGRPADLSRARRRQARLHLAPARRRPGLRLGRAGLPVRLRLHAARLAQRAGVDDRADPRARSRVGEEHVISAWKISSEGRKHRGGSAIHDAGGRLVAVAEALWITPRSRTL